MISLTKRYHFDAAHHLPFYDGKCNNIHGHRWFLEAKITGPIQTHGFKMGMILDFADLNHIIETSVLDLFDHTDINTQISNPTAENMIASFVPLIQAKLDVTVYGIKLIQLRLYETEDAYAEWTSV